MSQAEDAGADPRDERRAQLGARLRDHEAALVELEQRDARLSRGRVVCFVLILAAVIAAWQVPLSWGLVAIPSLVFFGLLVVHDRVVQRRDRARRAVAHYEAGLARLHDRWAGTGVTRSDYFDGEHPYAADLDLFGEGSLFELLCRARTRGGEQTLARWLTDSGLAPPPIAELRSRQASVRALAEELDLREELAVLGADVRVEVRPEVLIDWGRAPPLFSRRQRRWLPVLGLALPAVAIAGLVAWAMGLGAYVLVIAVVLEGAVYRALKDTLARVAGPAERYSHELGVLASMLARVEVAGFEEPRLVELREALGRADDGGSGGLASAAIAGLRRLAGWYEAQRNALFFPVALILMWGPNFALAIERWRQEHGPRIAGWIDALAELEALISLASHAWENPDDPFPELVEQGPELEGVALGHPLLPRASCVPNSIALLDPVRAHVISGSNMSGKSTFLRTLGTNVVLAQAGAPIRGASLRLSPLRVGATLRVQDSLREGASRFWAELTRLRRIRELAEAGPTLFLLDEIFHGTNSHDRRIGAEALLESLIDRGAVGLLTTHDLALARAAEALAPRVTNVHFEDELVEGELHFDYRMREGVVRKSNALALMRSVGLLEPEA